MAFASKEIREEAKKLLIAGKNTTQIMELLKDGCIENDLKNLRFTMKKNGIKLPDTVWSLRKPRESSPRKSKIQSKKIKNDFPLVVAAEIQTVTFEIDKMRRLMELYDKKNPSFASHLEKNIQREERKLELLKELHTAK